MTRPLVSAPASFIGTCALLVAAFGGGQSEAQSPPVARAPAASTSANAEPVALAPPPAAAPKQQKRRHHGLAAMVLGSVKSLELTPEQKATVASIEGDFAELGDAQKDAHKKLGEDIADGVALGKIDHTKTDADVAAVAKAIEATIPTIQNAVNRLHKALTPEQRKQFVANMHKMAAKIQENMARGNGDDKGALGLTPVQKEKLQATREADMKAQQGAMKQQMDAMKKQEDSIAKALESDKFDAKEAGIGQQAPVMAKKMAANRVKFAETMLSVLTPEQRAKFATQLRGQVGDPD
jgi:Spy/CpxP family protein refolding chaperone